MIRFRGAMLVLVVALVTTVAAARPADAIHEFAHHLDWECGFDSEEEEALFAVTGLAGDLQNSERWYRPAEIFAEAVVKLALGSDASSIGGRVTGLHPGTEILDFVFVWGGGVIPTAHRGILGTLISCCGPRPESLVNRSAPQRCGGSP